MLAPGFEPGISCESCRRLSQLGHASKRGLASPRDCGVNPSRDDNDLNCHHRREYVPPPLGAVRLGRFELPTTGLEGQRSNPLNYKRVPPPGLEPRLRVPKTRVLPLHHGGIVVTV